MKTLLARVRTVRSAVASPESEPGPLLRAPRPDADEWAKVRDKMDLLEK